MRFCNEQSSYGVDYGLIDDLTYEYSGNQVSRISDACDDPYYQGAYHFRDGADEAVEYTYDANGRMASDLNRRISSITYDINNRPRAIVFNGGAQTRYIYDAAGVKLRTEHLIPTVPPAVPMDSDLPGETMTTVTDYCGDIIYENGRIERINLENGYLSYKDGNGNRLTEPEYMFYLRDHLGNNRVTLRGRDGGIFQIDHYYPFGLPMGCGYYMSFQQWRFGGKEFDRTAGLDQYDFEARAYDPSTARFTRPDDLAEKYLPLSPYLYCGGNPINNIDPTGKDYKVTVDKDVITISANIYTLVEYEESAKIAANFWNSQSGTHKIGDQTVNFDIQIISVNPKDIPIKSSSRDYEQKILNYAANNDKESIGNTYILSDNLPDNINGRTRAGTIIMVKHSQSEADTGAHEIGHILGLGHYESGLMTPSSTDSNRSKNVKDAEIKDIVKGAIFGSPIKDSEAGKGTLKLINPQYQIKF